MDFNEELKSLQEEFNEIFERNKENLGAKKEVKKIVKDMGYYKDYLKAHNINFPDPNLAKMKGDLERAKNKLREELEELQEQFNEIFEPINELNLLTVAKTQAIRHAQTAKAEKNARNYHTDPNDREAAYAAAKAAKKTEARNTNLTNSYLKRTGVKDLPGEVLKVVNKRHEEGPHKETFKQFKKAQMNNMKNGGNEKHYGVMFKDNKGFTHKNTKALGESLQEQLEELQQQFNEIFEDTDKKVDKLSEGDNLSSTVYRIAKTHKMNGRKANRLLKKASQVPSHNDYWYDKDGYIAGKHGSQTKDFSKRIKGDIENTRKQELSRNKNWEISGNQARDEREGFPKAIEKSISRHSKKMNINNSLEELQSQFNEIFEATPGEKKVKENKNKIRKPGKNKKGEPVEVVSVADELFPYEGSAKEQMDKKILAKINDMIQGQATLQDLIGLVRSKKAVVASNESLDEKFAKIAEAIEIISEIDLKTVFSMLDKRRDDWDQAKDQEERTKKYSTWKKSHYDAEDKTTEKAAKCLKAHKTYDKWKVAKKEGRIKPYEKQQKEDKSE